MPPPQMMIKLLDLYDTESNITDTSGFPTPDGDNQTLDLSGTECNITDI